MRIYLPSTLPLLATAVGQRQVTDGPAVAFAVTPALREWYAEGDLEELEYAALTAAARQSLSLLAADPDAPRRRVVLAADVPEAAVQQLAGAERAHVSLAQPVPWAALAAVHVDAAQAEPVVAAACDAVADAVRGEDDAQFVLDSAEDETLLWYAVQEAGPLLAALGVPVVGDGAGPSMG